MVVVLTGGVIVALARGFWGAGFRRITPTSSPKRVLIVVFLVYLFLVNLRRFIMGYRLTMLIGAVLVSRLVL